EPASGPQIALRQFPYPFKAMLALCSDIDQTTRQRYRMIHRFLNTETETPMGPGLGLDVADSFWFYGRGGPAADDDGSDFVYFRGLDWRQRSTAAEELVHYLRSGWIDTI